MGFSMFGVLADYWGPSTAACSSTSALAGGPAGGCFPNGGREGNAGPATDGRASGGWVPKSIATNKLCLSNAYSQDVNNGKSTRSRGVCSPKDLVLLPFFKLKFKVDPAF